MPKGVPKPPIIADDAYAEKFAQKKELTKSKSPSLVKMAATDREYLRGMFEVFKAVIEPKIVEGEVHTTRKFRYTPRQMWENTKKYFEVTIEYGQPLAVMGIATFNGVAREDLIGSAVEKLPKEYHFLIECAKFVELYNEYAAHRKQNPAGPIFILKNFGWKDKFEIEASTNPGALSESERAEAQKRIGNFTEPTKGSVAEKIIGKYP